MIHLIYISSTTKWPTENDLLELLAQARARNIKQNVTGMLVYHKATFMQVLEGAEEDVHDIYNSILRDSRNNGNFILVEEEIEQREFPGWSMGFKDLKSCSPEELTGFQDIFNSELDNKALATDNANKALALIRGFAQNP
jgi:Sensors of blue-light using FAD